MEKESTILKREVITLKNEFYQRGVKFLWPVYVFFFPKYNDSEHKTQFTRVLSLQTTDKEIVERLRKIAEINLG